MDYDRTNMAEIFDRGRSHGSDTIAAWMKALTPHAGRPKAILDLGCGTGRFTQALSEHFDADVLGVDPSQSMLAVARAKPRSARVRYETGAAADIPLADASVDLVFMSMIYHHVPDPIAGAREIRRILRPGGVLLIVNGARDVPTQYDQVFPGYREVYDGRTPSRAEMRRAIEAGGLAFVADELVRHKSAESWLAFGDKIALRADSNLALMDDDVFDAGVASVRRFAEQADPRQPVMVDIPLLVFERLT